MHNVRSSATCRVDKKIYNVTLWDTIGDDAFDGPRPLSDPQTDVFLLCFSIDNPATLRRIREKWHPEIKYHAPRARRILVGTKSDLRDDDNSIDDRHNVTRNQGRQMAKEIGTFYSQDTYVECSSKKLLTLDKLLEEEDFNRGLAFERLH